MIYIVTIGMGNGSKVSSVRRDNRLPAEGPCGPGVDSASNRNEYQEYFMVVKAADAYG
jgi:hypothetical protein